MNKISVYPCAVISNLFMKMLFTVICRFAPVLWCDNESIIDGEYVCISYWCQVIVQCLHDSKTILTNLFVRRQLNSVRYVWINLERK